MSWTIGLEVTERGSGPRRVKIRAYPDANGIPVASIGRVSGNALQIPRGNISKRHVILGVRDGKVMARDAGSTNGTYLNGLRIAAPTVIRPQDRLYVGDHVVRIIGAPVPTVPPPDDAWLVDLELGWGKYGVRTVETAPLRHVGDDRHELVIGSAGELVVDGSAKVEAEHCKLIINEGGGSWIAPIAGQTLVDGEVATDTTRFPLQSWLEIGDYRIRLMKKPISPPGFVDR